MIRYIRALDDGVVSAAGIDEGLLALAVVVLAREEEWNDCYSLVYVWVAYPKVLALGSRILEGSEEERLCGDPQQEEPVVAAIPSQRTRRGEKRDGRRYRT